MAREVDDTPRRRRERAPRALTSRSASGTIDARKRDHSDDLLHHIPTRSDGMTCLRCQAENPDGTRFCGQCGTALVVPCAACGAANPPAHKFCGQCGAALAGSHASRFHAPAAYTPKHLADKILTSRSALEGERKQVTVLFADLKGSLELLAS